MYMSLVKCDLFTQDSSSNQPDRELRESKFLLFEVTQFMEAPGNHYSQESPCSCSRTLRCQGQRQAVWVFLFILLC